MENKGLCQQVGGVQHQGGGGGLHVVFLGLFIKITTETDMILYTISVGPWQSVWCNVPPKRKQGTTPFYTNGRDWSPLWPSNKGLPPQTTSHGTTTLTAHVEDRHHICFLTKKNHHVRPHQGKVLLYSQCPDPRYRICIHCLVWDPQRRNRISFGWGTNKTEINFYLV